MVRGSNPGWGEIFRTCPDRPWGPLSLLYNGYRVFCGGKQRLGRHADPSPLLVPWSRKDRAIPQIPLWAVRPVQSLSACTRVHFTFTYYKNWNLVFWRLFGLLWILATYWGVALCILLQIYVRYGGRPVNFNRTALSHVLEDSSLHVPCWLRFVYFTKLLVIGCDITTYTAAGK
jgi:hypothetical protein